MVWPFRSKTEAPAVRVEPRFRATSPENPNTSLANPASWLTEALGGNASYAGPYVSEQTAMRSTTVFRCVSLVAGLIAALPFLVYEKIESGRRDAVDHRLFYLLHDEPNDLMSAFTWIQFVIVDLLLGGNHYSLIEYDNASRVVGFFPLKRNLVTPYRKDGRNRYRIRLELGGEIDVDQEDILHIPGLGFDGLRGISPIAFAGKQAIGTDLAMSEATGRIHSNGVRPSGILEVPANISEPNFKRLTQQFEQNHVGVANFGKAIVADGGSKWTSFQLTPEDAQTLESRRFQVADICRLFGVPPHLAMESSKETSWGTGIEQQTLSFLRFGIEPWLKSIEGEVKRKLFARSLFYAEFNREALLAMDAKTWSEVVNGGIQNGYYMPAEARKWKNLPPVVGADRLFVNGNLRPIDEPYKAGAASAAAPGAA